MHVTITYNLSQIICAFWGKKFTTPNFALSQFGQFRDFRSKYITEFPKGSFHMKNFVVVSSVVGLLLFTTGCATTFTSIISGPLTGGMSLTEKLHDSDASVGTRILATPFTFLGGTATGIIPALAKGMQTDSEKMFDSRGYGKDDFSSLFDPFDSGMFPKKNE